MYNLLIELIDYIMFYITIIIYRPVQTGSKCGCLKINLEYKNNTIIIKTGPLVNYLQDQLLKQ